MIIILLYIFLFLILYQKTQAYDNIKKFNIQTKWSFIFLVAFFCFRGLPVLNDTHHYYNGQLQEIADGCLQRPFYIVDPLSRYGVGYQIFQHIVANISVDPYALIFFSSLIFTVATIWFLRKYSDDISLSIFILLGLSLLFGEYAALRQSLATSLFYISCWCCIKKKHIYGIIAILVATTFHSSASVLLILYVVFQIPTTKRNIIISLLVSLIVCLYLLPILSAFDYGENHYVTDMKDRTNIPFSALLITILFSITMIYCVRVKNQYGIEKPDKIIVWGAIFGLFFNAASIIVIAFDRLALYTSIFNVLFFVHYFVKLPRSEQSKLINIVVFVVICRMSLEMGLKNEWKHLVPYSFYDFSSPGYQDFGY